MTKANGATSIRNQCLICGFSGGDMPSNTADKWQLSEFDESLQKKWFAESSELFRAEQERLSDEWWRKYSAYLGSPHWEAIRRRVLKRDAICQVCFGRPSEQAHHISYSSYSKWGISFAEECVGVCIPCHTELHAREAK